MILKVWTVSSGWLSLDSCMADEMWRSAVCVCWANWPWPRYAWGAHTVICTFCTSRLNYKSRHLVRFPSAVHCLKLTIKTTQLALDRKWWRFDCLRCIVRMRHNSYKKKIGSFVLSCYSSLSFVLSFILVLSFLSWCILVFLFCWKEESSDGNSDLTAVSSVECIEKEEEWQAHSTQLADLRHRALTFTTGCFSSWTHRSSLKWD